jgi:hypothetical protein
MILSRLASLIVAAAYLIAAITLRSSNAQILIAVISAALVPLPFIWFPEALGSYVGPADLGSIQRPTPGLAIAVTAWFILAVIPGVILVMTG